MASRREDAEAMLADPALSPFHRLVLEAKRDRKITYDDIEAASGTRPDGRPYIGSRTAWKLMTTPFTRPPAETSIVGLSNALRIPQRRLRAAVSVTLGLLPDALPTSGGTLAHVYADRIDALTDRRERTLILDVVSRLLDAAEALEFDAAEGAAADADISDLHAARNGVSGGRGAGAGEAE